jgi:hypothetical protein
MDRKVGIVVPYRGRDLHLKQFKQSIVTYLRTKNIRFELIIVHQDDAKLFNRGMLLNIGFKQAKKLRCDYVVFHDVDMLPIDVDYSYSDIPLHLSTNFELSEGEKERVVFDTYFGGVTLFPMDIFEQIDGYSNKYWGWGYEDDDLLLRCKYHSVELNKIELKNVGYNNNVLRFNGDNAYVKSKNVIDLNNDFTISICFRPNNLILNHNKQSDEFTAFSIPGFDFAISYTSFDRYNFCTFDSKFKPIYLNTDIKPKYKTNITLSYDSASTIIKMYQDGELVGETEPIRRYNARYRKEPYFYLGVGNPDREIIPNWFKGTIEYFAYYDNQLSADEIYDISNNNTKLLTENFGKYESADNLKTYYDSNHIENYKLTDLSGNDNDGIIYKCEIVKELVDDYEDFYIPHRRKSLFKSLKHDENGFVGNAWKDQSTRWNQLRFVNEVNGNHSLLENDGLSTLKYHTYGVETNGNIRTINVGI